MRLAIVALAALLAVAPRAAEAHATVISSVPAAGERVGATPGAVVLNFSEPLNRSLSRGEVTAPDGRRFSATASPDQAIQVPLDANTPGVYAVRWTAVSAVDGHSLSGSFQFAVGTSPAAALAPGTPGPAAADLAVASARAVEYAALLLAAGLIVLACLADLRPRLGWCRPGRRLPLALAVALAAGLIVVAAETLRATGSPGAAAAYLGGGLPGWARLARVGAEAVALGLAAGGPRRSAPALLAALVAAAAAGHGATVQPPIAGVAAGAVHLVSAGVWAGGILALSTFRPPGGWLGTEGRLLLRRFGPVALGGFAATAVTGLLRGSQELSGLRDLVASSYGEVLAGKAALVLAIAGLSFLAWRRRRVMPRLEAALALAVVAATALLTAFPLPPSRAQAIAAASRGQQANRALPRDGDLTLGTSAGESLVGVTLRPGLPGRNAIWIYVLPLEGEAAAARQTVRLSVAGRPAALARCGPACRVGEADLQGAETLEVGVGGRLGGVGQLTLPALPAPSARDVGTLLGPMDRLRTYRIDETLRPAATPLVARYSFEAPDRMALDLSTGSQAVFVGPVRYTRDGVGVSWKQEAALSLKVPSLPWESRAIVAPRTVGADELDGTPVRVVSFFEGDRETPIWYRLWIDQAGLARRVEMRAQAHFMDDRYYDFDAPMRIEPPG